MFHESHEWAVKRDPEDISPNLISNLEQTKVEDHKEAVKKLTKLRSPIPLESIYR